MSGDRYIIRRFSPVQTIGGGDILDPFPYRRFQKEVIADLEIFKSGTLPEKIAVKVNRAGIHGIKVLLIEGWIKAETKSIKESINALKHDGVIMQLEDILIHRSAFETFKEAVKKIVKDFHARNPLKPGMLKEELRAHLKIDQRLFGNLITSLKDIIIEKELVRLVTFRVALSQTDEALKTRISDALEKAGFQPATREELCKSLNLEPKHITDILKLMVKEGSLVRISDSIYITSSVYKSMIECLKDFFSRKSEMTVAEFRDILSTSRKYALPFLEYLDSNRITLRVGDIRKLLLK